WQNHEQARDWALSVLNGRTTFAADGSQIYAAKKTSVPVAAIQVGWFENPHDPTAPYKKGASFELLTPDVLFRDQEDPMNPDIRVEERRYLGEVARIGQFLNEQKGWRERGERMPLAFFDNPLLVPFSQKGLQNSFLNATVELVKLSRESQVPLVGYVDRSFSRDLISLLDKFGGRTKQANSGLYDAALLLRAGEAAWGNRTCYFYSRRRGLEAFEDPETGVSSVGFCYLQTAADTAPARLDVPGWVYESGLLEETVDVVRAECIVGLGYPYALESADHAAVISIADREAFFRALQEFASREKLDFSVSRKDESKQRRR
ncbi:MAG TPA: DNA double-strand break repair nuclease NurA, partial [Pyrinomonadaceae bacterium]|nr:DNA double-strand break repair nuclease NurA [Pyrinomonadaceae bacterium]